MKNPRNDAWQIVNENLKVYYPSWSSNAVQIVTNNLFRRFKDLINQDTFAVADIVSEGVLILNKRHSSGIILSTYWLNPGFHLELAKAYNKQKGGMYSVEDGYFNQILQEENINPNENYKNISLYADAIIKGGTLTVKESELFLLMIEISLAELEGEFYKNLNKVAVEIGLTEKDSTFRKTFQRLREKLLDLNNKASLDLILFANQQSTKITTTITDFINYIETQLIIKNHLKAYRFSEQEMNKMIKLKKIFEDIGFKINRFPEVYIDEEYCLDELDNFYENPDRFGCYKYIVNDDKTTQEGIIIIYSKAIKDYCSNFKLNKNHFALIVLMHELGHWLSHWPKWNNKNWRIGYSADDKKTHESFAQLIAYWAIQENEKLKKILLSEHLTPILDENPYALYKKLLDTNKTLILNKLIEIREHYFLSNDLITNSEVRYGDGFYFDFLMANEISLFNFFIIKFNTEKKILINSPINNDSLNSSYILDNAQVKFYSELIVKILPTDETTVSTRNYPIIIADKLYKLGVFNNDLKIGETLANHHGHITGGKFGL